MEPDKIFPYLKKNLPQDRYSHILGVVSFSERLARLHRVSSAEAKFAAALHDLARCWSDRKLIQYVKKHRLKIPDCKWIIRYQPILLHSYVGADLAKTIFKVRSLSIRSAIAKHTLGETEMSRLDKLIYIADLAALDRNFSDAARLRELAEKSLDCAFTQGLRIKLEYLLKSKSPIHPQTHLVWNRFAARV